jgi:hypothetical protein
MWAPVRLPANGYRCCPSSGYAARYRSGRCEPLMNPRVIHAFRFILVGILAAGLPLAVATPASAARTKSIRISDASVIEGASLSFRLTWSGSKGGPAPSVHYSTADASANAAADYTVTAGIATLTNGGCRCATVIVPTLDDNLTEPTETLVVNLTSPSGGTIADGQGIGTIYDNEGPPALVVYDASADESASLSFQVRLTNASASSVSVAYATADGTALAGTDYAAASATLVFNPGQTLKVVTVGVTDDSLGEDDETLVLSLSDATNAGITRSAATGTIVDDDPDPDTTVSNASAEESAATATFTVSLSAASGRDIAVDWTTDDATALAGADYVGGSGTVTIPAGSTSGTFDVVLLQDATYEGDEVFGVALTDSVNATIVGGAGTGTIADDDPLPTASVIGTSIAEGSAGATPRDFSVSLSNPSAFDVSVAWGTEDGTAIAGTDYVAGNGIVTVPAGATSAVGSLTVLGDTQDEPNETLTVSIVSVTNGNVGMNGLITLVDDDKAPTAITVKALRTPTVVKARGLLSPASADLSVSVTLLRQQGSRWVKVGKRSVVVRSLKDRDGNGALEGTYTANFNRPPRGRYRFRVAFRGDADLLRSKRTLRFRV